MQLLPRFVADLRNDADNVAPEKQKKRIALAFRETSLDTQSEKDLPLVKIGALLGETKDDANNAASQNPES